MATLNRADVTSGNITKESFFMRGLNIVGLIIVVPPVECAPDVDPLVNGGLDIAYERGLMLPFWQRSLDFGWTSTLRARYLGGDPVNHPQNYR